MEPSPEPLKAQFLARIDQSHGDDPDLGLELWRMIVTDPWSQEQLRRYATAVVRKRGARLQESEEVEQQARLVLQQKLAKNPTLNFQQPGAREVFVQRMQRTFYNACCDAAAAVLDNTAQLTDQQLDRAQPLRPADPMSQSVKVKRALLQLPASQRTVLTLKGDGKKIKQIARLMQLSERQVKYLLKLARQEMKRLLSSETDDAPR